MKRGEVRWHRFAKPDKRRPVVFLTRDSILEYLGEATVPRQNWISPDDEENRDDDAEDGLVAEIEAWLATQPTPSP